MAYSCATRWESGGVVYDLLCRDLPPLEDGDLGINCNFDGPLPPDPPADPPGIETIEVEPVEENEPPMVWEVISRSDSIIHSSKALSDSPMF